MNWYKKRGTVYGNKYGNKRVEHAGRRFDSKLEKAVYDVLLLRQAAGELVEVQQQCTIHLTRALIGLRVDFRCKKADGEILYIEGKGFETPEWGIKLRLWRHYGPGPLEIWKGSAAKPYLHETVIPKGET